MGKNPENMSGSSERLHVAREELPRTAAGGHPVSITASNRRTIAMRIVAGTGVVLTAWACGLSVHAAWAADKPTKPAPLRRLKSCPRGGTRCRSICAYKMLLYELAQVNEELKAVIQKQVWNVAGQG